jgi:SAM-dependent methyltransferase
MSDHRSEQSLSAAAPARALSLERISCPLCGSSSSRLVQQAPDNLCGLPGLFSVERCLNCQHIFMNPRPTLTSLGACYPPDYGPHQPAPVLPADSHGDTASANPRVPWYLRYLPLKRIPGLRRFFYWLVDDRSQPVPAWPVSCSDAADRAAIGKNSAVAVPPRFLEIGCSTGRYLQKLEMQGWQVMGIEPGEVPAATARAAGLNVVTGRLETTELQPATFDAAAAWMVIEHTPDPRDTLTRLAQVLRPGAQLLFSIPNAGCWEPGVFGSCWYLWELPRHLHHFSPASIQTLLRECGFTSVQVIHQRTLLNIIGSLGIALTRWRPNGRLGKWLKFYPDNPTLRVQLPLAPIAQLLAFLRQSGRLTVIAERSAHPIDRIVET